MCVRGMTGVNMSAEVPAPLDFSVLRVQPMRHRSRWVVAVVALLVVAYFVRAFVISPEVGWHIIRQYLFAAPILSGVRVTIEVTLCAEVGALVIGLLLATARLSKNPVLRVISFAYTFVIRSIPPLVLLIFIYNLAFLFPHLAIGIPFTNVNASTSMNKVISGFSAAVVGLALSDGAYMGEIVRAGLMGVDPGQSDGARAIGASNWLAFRKVILPQAMRLIIPPCGNNFIGLLKASSLVSVISGADLMTQDEVIYSRTFEVIPLLLVAAIWYLALVGVATLGQQQLEKRFGHGYRPSVDVADQPSNLEMSL